MDCIICGSWFASTIHDGSCPACSRAIKQLGLNMTPNRLIELARAEKDERLAVLPCKPGTELFTHCHVRGANQIAHSYFYPPYIPTLGKNAWLTREEAEAALEKREEDNEAD